MPYPFNEKPMYTIDGIPGIFKRTQLLPGPGVIEATFYDRQANEIKTCQFVRHEKVEQLAIDAMGLEIVRKIDTSICDACGPGAQVLIHNPSTGSALSRRCSVDQAAVSRNDD